MADRVYGPIRGAGVQVREKEPERNIIPGLLGSTVMVGVFERGAENDIILCPNKKTLLRKTGDLLDSADFNTPSFASLEAPLATQHFFDHSEGAGFITCLRVVPQTNDVTNDDRPDKAELEIFNRESNPRYIGKITAQNGGRWAGQREYYLGKISGVPGTDFPTDNQLLLAGIAAKGLKRDEFKGGIVHVHGITSKTYTVVSNSSIGLFTFAADVDLPADWAAAGPPVDLNVTVYRSNYNYHGDEKNLSVVFKDGTLDPSGKFGMQILVNGTVTLDYKELSMDTASPAYWRDVVNNDPNNDLVTITDSFSGNRSAASARPANRVGASDALTASVLTIADPVIYSVASSGNWVPGLTWTTWGSSVVPQKLTVEVTSGVTHAIKVTTSIGNREYTGTIGTSLVTNDPYIGTFTVTTASGTDATGDKCYIYLRPLFVNELVGGLVNPKTTAATQRTYSIISNTRTTVTISTLEDMTSGATAGDPYLLSWPERCGLGYDGYVAGMTTADYEALLSSETSPLKKLKTMNLGLVKLAVPGIAKPSPALAMQQKARDLCLSYNWEYRVEIPDEYTNEYDVLSWVNNSFGRLDLAVAFFPTFVYIRDPLADVGSEARETMVSVLGMLLGREARTARDWNGYHKAAAGIDVTLPLVTRSDVLGRPDNPSRLDEEMLNPAGVNALRWASGGSTMIAWGDRTLDSTTVYRYKHKRELLSHYENILLENMDWSIFQINDPDADADVLAVVHSYFLEEYRKRAIRGDTFVGGTNPAAIIKMDAENNTNATREAGNQNIEISLRFADVVERLIITVSAMGVTELR